jgi:CheY-like chemotaxis protein
VARILMIDNEASIRKPLQLLERAGHEVVSAANGSEAVRLLEPRES